MVAPDDLYTRIPPSYSPPPGHLEMIRDLDVAVFRKTVPIPSSIPGAENFVALMSLHKMRYEWTAIDDSLRHESGRWLSGKGFGRLYRGDILPDGILPRVRP